MPDTMECLLEKSRNPAAPHPAEVLWKPGTGMLRLGGIVKESIVDGPGIRMTVFAQGCTHACPGCHNQDLQPAVGGTMTSVADILAMARRNPLLDGITLSGGEPFQQADGCASLAASAKAAGLHVMVYSGYTFEELLTGIRSGNHAGWQALLDAADVLVDGRFVLARRDLLLRFRGSSNQRLLDVPSSLQAGAAVMAAL